MTINSIIQHELPPANQPSAAQPSGNALRVKAELQQNLPVNDKTIASTQIALALEGNEPVTSRKPSHDDVAQAVQAINDHILETHRELQFSVDQKSGQMVVKVVDTETKDVIRQIPSEEVLALARNVQQDKGFVIEARA